MYVIEILLLLTCIFYILIANLGFVGSTTHSKRTSQNFRVNHCSILELPHFNRLQLIKSIGMHELLSLLMKLCQLYIVEEFITHYLAC